MNKFERNTGISKTIGVMFVCWFLFCFCCMIGVGFVIAHFLAKFW